RFWGLGRLDSQPTVPVSGDVHFLSCILHLCYTVTNTTNHQPTFIVSDINQDSSLDGFDNLIDLGIFTNKRYRIDTVYGKPAATKIVLFLCQEQFTPIPVAPFFWTIHH